MVASTIIHVGDGLAGDEGVGGVASRHTHALVQDDVHAAIEEVDPGFGGEGVADENDFVSNTFKGEGPDDALVATADIVDANEGVVPVKEITHDVEITDDVIIAGAGHDVMMHLYPAHQRTKTDFPVFSDLVKMAHRSWLKPSRAGSQTVMGTCPLRALIIKEFNKDEIPIIFPVQTLESIAGHVEFYIFCNPWLLSSGIRILQ